MRAPAAAAYSPFSQRDLGDARVAERLGDDERRHGDTGDDVEAQVLPPVGRKPAKRGDEPTDCPHRRLDSVIRGPVTVASLPRERERSICRPG